MPSYNRQLYNINALYVGPSPATGYHFTNSAKTGTQADSLIEQFHRITSFNDTFNIPLEGATQVGQLAEFTRQPLGTPTPGLTFDYYLHNGVNEDRLGFSIDGSVSFLSGILNKQEDEKNYFLLFVPEGSDAAGYDLSANASSVKVVGIGNGYLTNWSLNASVGDFATCSASIEGLNYAIKTGFESVTIPAVNPDDGSLITNNYYSLPDATTGVAGMPKIIKRGDIEVDFTSMAGLMGVQLDQSSVGAAHIQSISLDVPLNRTPLERLTSKYAFSREPDFPINATLSVETLVSDLNTGLLANYLGCGLTEYDFTITFKSCEGNVTTPVFKVIASGATLDQQSFQQAAGSQGRTATVNFTIPLASAESAYPVLKLSGSYAP